MAELTYDDFKARLSIQDVLIDAGYKQNRRDGLRYPSFVRFGSDGKRVHGDKFIVTANGLCCFQPPERKNYNIISFIKEHPDMFAEYRPGMDKDRLVNLVCNRLLNQPIIDRSMVNAKSEREVKPFNLDDYTVVGFNNDDWESQKKFYPYFKNRGISLETQRAFSDHFFLSMKAREDGKGFVNLSFPLTHPDWSCKGAFGLEERSRPNEEGKCAYKGLAAGSDAANCLWIGRLENHRSDQGFTKPISEAPRIYWFESAYDAMAFYQLNKDRPGAGDSVYVSTSGNPSNGQIDNMLRNTPNAQHVLCFDADEAGEKFAKAFYLRQPEANIVREYPAPPHKDFNEELLAHNKALEEQQVTIGGLRR